MHTAQQLPKESKCSQIQVLLDIFPSVYLILGLYTVVSHNYTSDMHAVSHAIIFRAV